MPQVCSYNEVNLYASLALLSMMTSDCYDCTCQSSCFYCWFKTQLFLRFFTSPIMVVLVSVSSILLQVFIFQCSSFFPLFKLLLMVSILQTYSQLLNIGT